MNWVMSQNLLFADKPKRNQGAMDLLGLQPSEVVPYEERWTDVSDGA
jgi:hypothetical protein